MGKTFIILFILLNGLGSCAQDLTCGDFKIGKFHIPQNEEMRGYTIAFKDSVMKFTPKKDSTINKYIVVRSERTQTEWINGLNQGVPQYEKIDWIDECSYRLTYDESRGELDKGKQWINNNNGIVVSKVKIEGKCMIYNAIMTTTEGRVISQKGIICKE